MAIQVLIKTYEKNTYISFIKSISHPCESVNEIFFYKNLKGISLNLYKAGIITFILMRY